MTDFIKRKIVNFFPGPGAGKSTTSAHLFSELKYRGRSCELIPEFAKELTYEERHIAFRSQDYIFGEQHFRQKRASDKVEFTITDSPLILCDVYAREYGYPLSDTFIQHVQAAFNGFDNLNIYIRRSKKFDPNGRNQDEAEARRLDIKIKDMLDFYEHDYHIIEYGRHSPLEIIQLMVDHGWTDALSDYSQEQQGCPA